MTRREVREGRQEQGTAEAIPYQENTNPWGGSPTNVAVTVIDQSNDTDVTSTGMSGTASVSGNWITLPTLSSLTAGRSYRVNVKFTTSKGTLVGHAFVDADRNP